MAFNLASLLLGPQAATMIGQGAGAPATEDIVVSGAVPPRPAPVDTSTPPNLGNRDILEEAAQARANAPQRTGMFGTKGTLRDILGTIGDAFLVQSGNKAMYAPHRQQEKMSDALAGFSDNPLAAIERLAAGGFADQATELYKTHGTLENARATAGLAGQKARDENYRNYATLFAQHAGASSPETYANVAPLLKVLKERGGLGDEFQVPDAFDAGLMNAYKYGGMPATQQVRTEQGSRRLTEQERHNRVTETTGRISATRPRSGGREPQPTAMSTAAPILAKVQRGEPITAGEREVLERTAPVRGKGGRRGPPPLPPGFGGAKKVN